MKYSHNDLATFLEQAASYFERRPTHGEDMAFWANVMNAEKCRAAAVALRSKPEQLSILDGAA